MATAVQKITLSASRDIPFNKLVLSQSNVRRIKAGVSIEELAEDIARRTLLQSLTVRPVRDADGVETGMYEIPAGGRRYRALELLVKQKRLAKTAPVPCVVREGGIAEEDSLAENVQRAPLHPLDQFRAFLALREKGQSEEEIAAAFFVSVAVVSSACGSRRSRRGCSTSMRKTACRSTSSWPSPSIGDHARQEQVFERLSALLHQGALCHPPHADRRRGAGLRQAGASSSASTLTKRLAASFCTICSRATMVAGCRMSRWSIAWSPKSWSARRKRSAPRAGNGSRSRPSSPMATPTACVSSAAKRFRSRRTEEAAARRTSGRIRPARGDLCGSRGAARGSSISVWPKSRRRSPPSRSGRSVSIRPRSRAPAPSSASMASGHLRVERGYVRPEDEAPVEPEPVADSRTRWPAGSRRTGGP